MARGVDDPIPLGSSVGDGAATRRLAPWGLAVLAATLAAVLLLDLPQAILAALWAVAAAAVVRSDLDRFVIPDEASAAIAALGLANAVLAGWSEGPWAVGNALLVALSGGAVAFAVFWLVALVYRRRAGRDGLGFGDVKLAGASGLWLSFAQQTATVEIACLAALAAMLVLGRGRMGRHVAVPFGAFLAPAAWLVFVGDPLFGRLIERLP